MPANEKNEARESRGEWREISLLLKNAYLKKKGLNKGFSLGVVARRLEVSVPFLSQLFSEKRALPLSMVEPMCTALDLDTEKRDFLYRRLLKKKGRSPLTQLTEPPAQGPASGPAEWSLPPASSFWVLEEWFYLPLLNCTLLPAYDGKASTLSALLSLPLAQVEDAMLKLREAGFLEVRDGVLKKASRLNDFNSAASKEQIRAFHRACLRRAETELEARTSAEAVEERLITTLSITVAAEHVGSAKQRIADFLRQLSVDLTTPTGSEVYQLGLQFFPVTQKGEDRPRE
ncbi:MAG: DUF4423 domain-containing protein [Proteobacteria bacterium]|nr:MAG: DUF4423 domain-containing protein [Pseudomonadota bacterium]